MHMTAADAPRRPDPLGTTDGAPDRVWYTAYGSNLHRDRLTCYLAGGRPPGARRSYPGCRDHSPPLATVPVLLPGQLYFALESKTWTGGMAFYDPFDEGELPARAYLLTAEQFADIAAQEMYRAPGTDLDLTGVLRTGRAQLGPGRYETLVCPGQLDGHPMLTFTAAMAPGRGGAESAVRGLPPQLRGGPRRVTRVDARTYRRLPQHKARRSRRVDKRTDPGGAQ